MDNLNKGNSVGSRISQTGCSNLLSGHILSKTVWKWRKFDGDGGAVQNATIDVGSPLHMYDIYTTVILF